MKSKGGLSSLEAHLLCMVVIIIVKTAVKKPAASIVCTNPFGKVKGFDGNFNLSEILKFVKCVTHTVFSLFLLFFISLLSCRGRAKSTMEVPQTARDRFVRKIKKGLCFVFWWGLISMTNQL